MTTPSRRQWTDDTIRAELLPIAEELGRFPRKTEVTERGLGGLWAAMGRRGGVDAWREFVAARLTAVPAAVAPAATVTPVAAAPAAELAPLEEHIAVAAYFMYENGHPGDPAAHWHEAERTLVIA